MILRGCSPEVYFYPGESAIYLSIEASKGKGPEAVYKQTAAPGDTPGRPARLETLLFLKQHHGPNTPRAAVWERGRWTAGPCRAQEQSTRAHQPYHLPTRGQGITEPSLNFFIHEVGTAKPASRGSARLEEVISITSSPWMSL